MNRYAPPAGGATLLATKSVHSPPAPDDGLRVLATRFRGRRLPADRYDVWMANLGPSEALLRSFLDREIRFSEFSRRYRQELFAPSEVDRRNRTIQNRGQKFTLRLLKRLASEGNVTLLCHCAEDATECHRHVLRAVIESGRV